MSRRARTRELVREAKHAAFYSGPEDDTHDEGGIDATNGSGPAGTYGCACVSTRSPRSCIVARSDSLPSLGEQCECLCHTWSDHDD